MKPDYAQDWPFMVQFDLSDASLQDVMHHLCCADIGDGIHVHVKVAPYNLGVAIAMERGFQAAKGNVHFTWQLSPTLQEGEWVVKDIQSGKAIYSRGAV